MALNLGRAAKQKRRKNFTGSYLKCCGTSNKNENYLISANGVKYWIDNGPLILRKKSLTK